MKLKNTLLAFLLSLICVQAIAQNSCNCDSFDAIKIQQLEDEFDSVALVGLVNEFRSSQNDACKLKASTIEFEMQLIKANSKIAYEILSQQEKFVNNNSCNELFSKDLYSNYCYYYKVVNDFENLSIYAYRTLQLAEKQNNKLDELGALKYLIFMFTREGQDDKLWEYIQRAQKIITSLPESYLQSKNYNWLAMEYESAFARTSRKSLIDSSLMYANLAKINASKYQNYEEIAQSFRVFEACNYHKGNLEQAVQNIDSAIYYFFKITKRTNPSSLYLAKSWDLTDLKRTAEAIRWADSSVFYAEKRDKGTPALVAIYHEVNEIYELNGNLSKAIATYKKYDFLKDSLFNLQKTEKINELEQKYNKAKNEKTIKELAQERRIYILLALASLLSIIALIFFIRQQALKNKQKILQTEQRLNRARMNPHFFFNALSSLQSFALQENDGKALASSISKFSHIMRETLESTYKEYVTIEQEIDFLNEYLELQKLRFPNKYDYSCTISDSIEPNELLIPSMILQPFVENSIEHGLAGIDYKGQIDIHFELVNQNLKITIIDNGIGLASKPKETSNHISRASQIIQDRIYLLNIKLKTKATFSIENVKNGKGVCVSILLPVLEQKDV